MEHNMYREIILDLYKHPLNFGTLANHTHSAKKNNPSCGDAFEIQLIVIDEKIIDAKFTGSGCAISTAANALLTEKIKGMTLKQAQEITFTDMQKELGIPISVGRANCATLGLDIIKIITKKE